MRLINDIDGNQIKRVFDLLRDETTLFQGLSQEEVASLQTVFRVLTFRKNDYVAKKGDDIEYVGVLLHGVVFASVDY